MRWIANSCKSDDRSGVAIFKAGDVEVAIPFDDVKHFHALCTLMTALEAQAVRRTTENVRGIVLQALENLR